MAKSAHKDRKHTQWSASSTERNWLCPGNLALVQDILPRPEGKAAAWGTACHEVSEKLLVKSKVEIGEVIETERHTFTVDQEMMDVAWVYVDYIRDRIKNGFDLYAVEKKFALDDMNLPIDIGGTADCVLYHPHEKHLEIVDLKTGKGGFVHAKGNPQERLYALGVLVSIDPPIDVHTVTTTIVQPRYADKDGDLVRGETMNVSDLVDWTIDLVPRVIMASEALKSYEKARQNSVILDDWVDTYLFPGEVQCQWCPAAGGCPALRKRSLAVAKSPTSHTYKSNLFEHNSVEGVESDLDNMEMLENWIRERRALAHEMAVQGMKFDHHSLVEKYGHRKFSGATEQAIVDAIKTRIGVDDDAIYDRKLKSPAGLERAVGKAAVEMFLDDIIVKPMIGTDLIRNKNTGGRDMAKTIRDFLEGDD
jgi:hypothetical protein